MNHVVRKCYRYLQAFGVALGLCLAGWFLGAPHAYAQSAAGNVNGTVVDASGGGIPRASVTLINKNTGVRSHAVTGVSGEFTFVNVVPGIYSLHIAAAGFKTEIIPSFPVSVDQTVTQFLKLAVGVVTQTVKVSAHAQLLEPTTNALGAVIGRAAVHSLPLNGRNFTELLTLTPGTSPINTAQGGGISTTDGGISGVPGSAFAKPSLQGQENRSVLYYLDGIINSDLRTSDYGVLPSIDSIREFKVVSHGTNTEYGGVLGGVINVATQSGGNQFHGSAYEFIRNNVLDARNPISESTVAKPRPFHQNQFGASIGGPVRLPFYNGRNKTFFYFSYDGWRFSQPTGSQSYIPTAAELNGNFSADPTVLPIYNPYSTQADPSHPGEYLRQQFQCQPGTTMPMPLNPNNTQAAGSPCNVIPPALISPVMQKFLQGYAQAPNLTGVPGRNFIITQPQTNTANTYNVRIDQHFKNDELFFRWTHMINNAIVPVSQNGINPTYNTTSDYGGGWTHVFSPNLILDARLGRMNKPYEFPYSGVVSSLGLVPALNSGLGGINRFQGAQVSISNSPFGGPGSNFGTDTATSAIRNNPLWSGTWNVHYIHGNHNFQFGMQYIHISRIQINNGQTFGFTSLVTNNPENPSTTGDGLASALLGLPDNFTGKLSSISEIHLNIGVFGFYMHDQWRLTPTFTLNYGVRYDLSQQPVSLGPRLFNGFSIANKDWILGASAYPAACNPPQYINPCIPGGLTNVPHYSHIVLAGKHNFMDAPNLNNWGPRIGMAWQVYPNTVVRASYGLFWDVLSARTQSAQNDLSQAGWPYTTGFNGVANRTTSGVPAGGSGNPVTPITSVAGNFATPLPAPTPWTSGGWADQPNLPNPYSEQWNFNIQHQFGANNLLSIAYVGSHDGQLPYTGAANAAPVASPNGTLPTAIDALRAVPWMDANSLHYTEALGYSNYNAFEASFQRHFSSGLSTLLAYTWSRALDNSSGYYNVENGAGGPAVQNFFDPASNYGPSGFNIPQYLSWETVWEPPIGTGRRWLNAGPAAWVLGNWQVNYVLTARSGQSYTLGVNAGDIANIGGTTPFGGYGRPNQIGNPFVNVPAGYLFNPLAFAIPSGSFGNVGRGTMISPGVWNMDFSLFKNIPLGTSEQRRLQLRFEAFNVFNHYTMGVPDTSIGSVNPQTKAPLAGFVNSLAAGIQPREIQLGLRIVF